MLEVYKPVGADTLKPAYRDTPGRLHLDRHGRLPRRGLREPPRGAEGQRADRHLLGRPAEARIPQPHRSCPTGFIRHGLSPGRGLACRSWASRLAGPTWTSCMRTSRSTPIPAPPPAFRPHARERVVGIGFDMRGARERTQGAPIDLILPREGAGWDMEATAIVRGTRNLAAARKLADWVASRRPTSSMAATTRWSRTPTCEAPRRTTGQRRGQHGQERFSPGWPKTASASWLSGAAATRARPRRAEWTPPRRPDLWKAAFKGRLPVSGAQSAPGPAAIGILWTASRNQNEKRT